MPIAKIRRNRKRTGPKLLPREALRVHRVEILLSAAELAAIEAAAGRASQQRAVWAREVLLREAMAK